MHAEAQGSRSLFGFLAPPPRLPLGFCQCLTAYRLSANAKKERDEIYNLQFFFYFVPTKRLRNKITNLRMQMVSATFYILCITQFSSRNRSETEIYYGECEKSLVSEGRNNHDLWLIYWFE